MDSWFLWVYWRATDYKIIWFYPGLVYTCEYKWDSMSPAPLSWEGTHSRDCPLWGFLFVYESYIRVEYSIDTLLREKWYYVSLYLDIIEYFYETTRTHRAYLVDYEVGRSIHAIPHRIIKRNQVLSIFLIPLSRCWDSENEISTEMVSQYKHRSLELVIFGYLRTEIDPDIAYPYLSSPYAFSFFILLFYYFLFLVPSIIEFWCFFHILVFRNSFFSWWYRVVALVSHCRCDRYIHRVSTWVWIGVTSLQIQQQITTYRVDTLLDKSVHLAVYIRGIIQKEVS